MNVQRSVSIRGITCVNLFVTSTPSVLHSIRQQTPNGTKNQMGLLSTIFAAFFFGYYRRVPFSCHAMSESPKSGLHHKKSSNKLINQFIWWWIISFEGGKKKSRLVPSRPSKIPEIRLCFALFWCFSFFLVIKQLFWESLVSLWHDSLYETTEDTTIIYKTLRKKNL